MKATLESRKSVRLHWFKQEKVPFNSKYSMEWSYTRHNIQENELSHNILMQYVFTNLENPVPSTSIVIFDENNLPQSYMSTTGSIGKKFSTENTYVSDINVKDRIVSYKRGEEKVTKKPVPAHESHRYKEIQVHEREDYIKRKINIENKSNSLIKLMETIFIENKDVQYVDSDPESSKIDAPEYKWEFEIPTENSVTIELELKNYRLTTYRIEKEDKVIQGNKNING